MFFVYSHAEQAVPLGAAFGAEAGATLGLAGLLEELPATHLLLDAAALDQFTEAADRLLNAFAFANRQFDHAFSGSSQAECEDARGAFRETLDHRKNRAPRPSVPGPVAVFSDKGRFRGLSVAPDLGTICRREPGEVLRQRHPWRSDGATKA